MREACIRFREARLLRLKGSKRECSDLAGHGKNPQLKEQTMKKGKLAVLAMAALFFLATVGGSALAQAKGPTAAPPAAAKAMKITVVGKIVKDESMGGYYIQGKKPPEIFRIMNQNPTVLEKYAKSGKEVTMEAHSAMGDNLVIETINGKKYTEAKKK
jgi:hypothetical protein